MGKLMHKLKRERKGAKKEIRQDSAFLARRKAADERERQVAKSGRFGCCRQTFHKWHAFFYFSSCAETKLGSGRRRKFSRGLATRKETTGRCKRRNGGRRDQQSKSNRSHDL